MSEEPTQQLPSDDLRRILAYVESIDSRLVRFDEKLTRLDDKIDARLARFDERLTSLEEKVDRRLQETRPIWEQVLARLDAVEAGMAEVKAELADVKARLGGVEKQFEGVKWEVYDLNRKFRVFTVDMMRMQDKDEDLEERVRKLESEAAS